MDYYKVLNLRRDADLDNIKKSYRKLALKYHPDKNKSPDAKEKFQEISCAYQTLSDEKSRKEYDNSGRIPTTFQNPEEMFKNIFSNMDPVLGKFLSNTLTEFTEILMNDETKSFGDFLTLFNKNDFIEKGSDVMKYYLKKNIKTNIQDFKWDKSTFSLTLKEESLDLDDFNIIDVDIPFLRKHSHIKLEINNGEKNKKFIISLTNAAFTLDFNDILYRFIIDYKFPPGIKRKADTFNLFMEYNIDIHDYINGFFFTYPLFKNYYVKANIEITGSNIVEFKNEGIYNCNDNKLGSLFVVFKPTKRGLRENTINNKENTLKSLDIKNLI